MDRVGSYLSYLYLLRVPLAAWLLLVLLPVLSVPRRAPLGPLLRGIFDLSDGGAPQLVLSFALVAFVSYMAGVAAGLSARLIVLDGHARFSAAPIPTEQPGVKLVFRLVALSAPIPLLSLTLTETYWGNELGWTKFLAGILGVAVGVVAFFAIMTYVHDWLWDLAFTRYDLSQAGEEVQEIAKFKRNFLLDLIAAALAGAIRWAEKIVNWSPAGYVVPNTTKLWNRHAFALIHLLLSLAFYLGLYLTKWNVFTPDTQTRIPTLCLALALIMLGCIALSALTFFFDRFRIPLLSLIILYAVFSWQFPQTDHFYLSNKTAPIPASPMPTTPVAATPAQATSGSQKKKCSDRPLDAPVILVAASGGGIQSAAWTAVVLSGLQKYSQDQGLDFDCSVKLISSVSGGSVGAMYFADAYQEDGTLPLVGEDLEKYGPVHDSEASSLEAVAWGLAYPDLGWTIAPFVKGIGLRPFTLLNGKNLTNDRGTALENAWRATPDLKAATLSGWRQEAAKGKRPAVVFNSTIVETGERFLMSTTDVSAAAANRLRSAQGRQVFSELYAQRDVDIVTAARLSATFPYVTPAARIWEEDAFAKSYHLADGGYYDNYGIVSLLDWLDLRGTQGPPYPKKVIIIQIRGFATQSSPLPSQDHGSLFDAIQPIETILNVRNTGQFSHNQVDMTFAQHPGAYPFKVCTVEFEFDAKDDAGDPVEPPLSWHLTPTDKYFLRHFWASDEMQKKREEFKETLLKP